MERVTREEIKFILLMAVIIILALVFHHKQRKKKGLGLTAYGWELLGIQEEKPGRKRYMDALRFLAVVLVIVNHSVGPVGAAFSSLLGNFAKGISADALVCNLLFVMISGALLLPYRDEKTGEFYVKRLSRVAIPLVAYYLCYLLFSRKIYVSTVFIWPALKTILTGPNDAVPHFWMAYLLLGLYIAVPYQRWMLKDLPDKILEGMAAVVFLGSVFRVVLYFIDCTLPFSSILFSWEGIFFLGYYLTQPCSKKYDRILLIGGAVSAVLIGYLSCVREDVFAFAVNYSPVMILFASAVFVWFRNREETGRRITSRGISVIVQVGNKYSFSILLIHWLILFIVLEHKLKISMMMFGTYGVFFAVLLQIVATIFVSFVFAFFFDQTVVFVMQQIWDKCIAVMVKLGGKR